jgi:hypothetical protein
MAAVMARICMTALSALACGGCERKWFLGVGSVICREEREREIVFVCV